MQKGSAPLGILIGIVLMILFSAGGYYLYNQDKLNSIKSFNDCAKHYPVMESYPEQCATPDGKHFTKQLTEKEKPKELPSVKPMPVMTNETSGWKTYQSDEPKYAYEYPGDWVLTREDKTSSIRQTFKTSGKISSFSVGVGTGSIFNAIDLHPDVKIISEDVVIDGVRGKVHEIFNEKGTSTSFILEVKSDDLYYTFNLSSLIVDRIASKELFSKIIESIAFL